MATIEFNVNFWTLFFLLINFILVLLTSLANRNKTTADDLRSVRVELGHDLREMRENFERELRPVIIESSACYLRINSLEATVRNMPMHDHLGEVHEKINSMGNQLEWLTAGNEKILSILERHIDQIDMFMREKK